MKSRKGTPRFAWVGDTTSLTKRSISPCISPVWSSGTLKRWLVSCRPGTLKLGPLECWSIVSELSTKACMGESGVSSLRRLSLKPCPAPDGSAMLLRDPAGCQQGGTLRITLCRARGHRWKASILHKRRREVPWQLGLAVLAVLLATSACVIVNQKTR